MKLIQFLPVIILCLSCGTFRKSQDSEKKDDRNRSELVQLKRNTKVYIDVGLQMLQTQCRFLVDFNHQSLNHCTAYGNLEANARQLADAIKLLVLERSDIWNLNGKDFLEINSLNLDLGLYTFIRPTDKNSCKTGLSRIKQISETAKKMYNYLRNSPTYNKE